MIDKDQVMQLVQMKGYVLPGDLTRQFHADTFIMGAVLSDLVREKKLQISRVKIGRSPVYYLTAQREKLQDLYKYLNEKDRRVYDVLKQSLVLRAAEQNPLVRVSLKTMKDYSKPIEVTIAGKTELFYKWYLATDQEVHAAITALLKPKIESAKQVGDPESIIVERPVLEKVIEKIEIPEPINSKKSIEKKDFSEKEKILPKEVDTSMEEKTDLKEDVRHDGQQHLADTSLHTRLLQHEDPFAQEIAHFFEAKNISIIHFKHIKKGEIDCLVKIPSAVGEIIYFCKAKKKKKCNEGDLATAFVAAQMKKLPTLFLTPGSFPKKVMQKLPTEYPNTKVLQLG